MNITEITPIAGERVTTDEEEFNEYIRYGVDCWYVQMGESDEPVYECRGLERLYQDYIKGNE